MRLFLLVILLLFPLSSFAPPLGWSHAEYGAGNFGAGGNCGPALTYLYGRHVVPGEAEKDIDALLLLPTKWRLTPLKHPSMTNHH